MPDELIARRADRLRLPEAPLGVLELPGDRFRRQMLVNCGSRTGLFEPGMDGHELEVMVELHGIVRGSEPQRLVHERIGRRVRTLLELGMTVAVELDLTPGSELDRNVGQGLQEGLLRVGKKG